MPSMSSHDAVIYAANDLITALTKPQPTNSFLSIRDDQLGALHKLATIFKCSTQKKPIADPGVPDIAPPHWPRTCSQTKALVNAAIRAPYGPTVRHTPPQPRDDPKHDEELAPDHLCDIQHCTIPLIVPIIQVYAHSFQQNMRECWKTRSPSSNQQTPTRTQTQGSNSSTNNSSIIQIASYDKRDSA